MRECNCYATIPEISRIGTVYTHVCERERGLLHESMESVMDSQIQLRISNTISE